MSSLRVKETMKKLDYHTPLYKDCIYHIYNRANGKEKIFFTEENYIYFLKQYAKYMGGLVDTFAFCQLSNHFHLLVRIKTDKLKLISEGFRKFFISYSMSINKQEKRSGNLFQRNYKRKIIEDKKYFLAAVYYIHANPVHHGIVKDFRNYKYSSYNSLIGDKGTKLKRDEVLELFGGKEQFINYHSEFRKGGLMDNPIIEDDER